MNPFDTRSEERKKALKHAFASDLKDSFDVKLIIRDVSRSGCMVVGSQLHGLPDLIQLIPEGFDNPLKGRIVWRKDKQAGIEFLSPASDEILSRMREIFVEKLADTDDDEPFLLECLARPLGYADRLAKYNPRAK